LDRLRFYKGHRTSLDDLNELQDFFEGSDHARKEIKEMTIKAGTKLIEEKGLQNCSARKTSVWFTIIRIISWNLLRLISIDINTIYTKMDYINTSRLVFILF